MTTRQARLVVVCPEDLAGGFRLAGAATSVSETPEQAEQVIRRLLLDGERGVIAVYAPLFEGLGADLKRNLQGSVSPVVVELPVGTEVEGDEARRVRLAERLQRAIGYHITFGEDQS